jgi:hypothetical protein
MKNCININTEEFKNLLKESNMNPVILAAKISLWQDNNGLNKYPTLQDLSSKNTNVTPDMSIDLSDSNEVAFNLKAVNILSSPKAEQIFAKGIKVNWDLNKILTELQVPKEQKQLILDLGKTNREEIITDLLANYSYAIEINIAKGGRVEPVREYIELPGGDFIDYETGEYEDLYEGQNSSFYSNLTVPGGTNYTENEIATPAITPSIKGHAQFATNKGIGWFRSDEQVTNFKNKEATPSRLFPLGFGGQEEIGGKTRRILEVQSDLFQKGRDRKDLISYKPEGSKEYVAEHFNGWAVYNSEIGVVESGFTTKEAAEKWLTPKDNKNDFLQLLNQGSNWVTFFVKSIIQDSAKKGYEKVLFPTGETAAKVEGHTTLAEQAKQINKEIQESELYLKQTPKEREDTIKEKIIEEKKNIEKNIPEIDKIEKEIKEIKDAAVFLYQEPGYNGPGIEGFTYARIQNTESPIRKGDHVDKLPKDYKGYYVFAYTNDRNAPVHDKVIPISNAEARAAWVAEGSTPAQDNQQHIYRLEDKLRDLRGRNLQRLEDELLEINKDYKVEQYKRNLANAIKDKQKLETEGFAKLKPVEYFYTNTVTNVLNKQYGKENVKQVTDEYGNTWNEIDIVPEREQEIDLSIDFFDSSFPLSGDLKQEFKDEIVNPIEREYKPLTREHIAFRLSSDKEGITLPYVEVFTPKDSQQGPTKVFVNETAVRIKEENLVGVANRLLTETNKKLLPPTAISRGESIGQVEKYDNGTVAIAIKPSLAFVLSYSIDPNFTADTSTSAVKYYYLSQFLSQKGLLKEYAGPLNELYTKGNVQDRIEKERQFLEEREREIQTEFFDFSEGDLSIDIPYDNSNGLYAIPDFNKVKLKRESQINNLSTRIETLKTYRKLNGEVNNVTARITYLEKLQKSLQKDLDDYLDNLTEEDRFQQIKSIFEKDFEQVRSLLQNPTVENVTLAKDMIDYIEINSTQENEESIFGLKKGEITNPSVEKLKNLLHSETQLLKDLYDQVTDKYVLELMTPMKEKFFSYFPKGATETDIEALERIRDTHLKSLLEDISKLEQQFLAEGRNLLSDSDLLAQMRRLLYESEEHKMLAQANVIKQKINLILPQLEQKLKELGYVSRGVADYLNYISLFYRKTKEGFSEPYLVGKYSEDWTNFLYGVFTRSREDLNNIFKNKASRNISAEIDTVLAAKYKQLNENADFVDFRYLHDVFANVPFFDDPLYKKGTTAEAAQYKADLIAKIGQSEYDEVVRKQTNYLREFQIEADIMTKEMLANSATNPLGVQTVAGLEQKFQNQLRHNIDRIDPFVLLDSHFTGNMSFVHFVQGITHNHFIKYNTFTPKVLNASGKPTPFYDKNFKIIENDDVLRTAWEVFEEASYFINASLIGSGRNLNKRSLLWFKKSFKEEFLNKNWKDTIKKQTFSDFFQDAIYWLKSSMAANKTSETSLTEIKLPSNMASFSSQVYEVHQNNVTVLSTLLKRVLKDKNKLDLDKMNLVDKQSFFETLGVIDESEFRSIVPVTKGVFSVGDLKEIAKRSVIETQTLDLPLMLKVQLEQAAINAARTSTTEKIQILLQKSQKQKTTDSTNTKVPRTNAEKRSAFFIDRIVRNQVENQHKAGKQGGNLISAWAKKIKKLNEENKPITIEDWKEGLKLFSQNLSREEKAKYKIITDRIEVVNNMLEQIEQANQTGQTIDINDETIDPNSEAIEELAWNLKEEKAKIEQQIRLMGKDLMWSALLSNSFTRLQTWRGMSWNYISSVFNIANARVQLINRDGEFWPAGFAYKALAFVDMRGLASIDKKYAKQWAIGEAIIERLNIISDGSNEFQRSERKGNINSPKLFRKLYGAIPVPNYELVSDPMYATKYAEYYNQIPSFYAKAMNKKIKDKNGIEYPLFDGKNFVAFDIDEQTKALKLNAEFDTPENRETFLSFTSDEAAQWTLEIKTAVNSINGDYSLTGSTMIKENLVGNVAMAFKTWLGEYMIARYSYDQKELATGTIRDGYIAGSLANKATRPQGYASLSQITLANVVFGSAAIAAFPAGMLAIALPIMAVVGGAAIYSGAVSIPGLKKLSIYSMGQSAGILQNLYKALKQIFLTNTVGLVEFPTNSAYAILQKVGIVNHLDKNGEIRKPLINPALMVANHKELSERQLRSIQSLVRTAVILTYCSLAMMLAAGDDEEEKELEGEEGSLLRSWSDKQKQKELDKKNSWREKARIGIKNAMGRTMEETSLGTNPLALINMFIGDDSTIKGGTIPFTENLGESLIRSMQEEGEGDIVTDPKSMYYADSKFEVGLRRNLMFSSTKNIGKNEWLLGVEGILQKDFYENNYEDWFKQTDLKEDQKKYKNLKVLSLVEIREKLAQQYLKIGYKEIKNAKDLEDLETLAKREFEAQQYSPKKESRGFYTEDQRRISTPESEVYFKNLKERE